MQLRYVAFLLLLILSTPSTQAQHRADDDYVQVPFNVGLVPGVSLGDLVAGDDRQVVHNLSFSIFGGRAARLNGFAFAGLWNRYDEGARGFLFAGLYNTVADEMRGFQFGGLGNVVGDDLHGGQFGGLGNIAGEDVRGGQFSGFLNIAGQDVRGGQFAGFMNIAGEDGRGGQFAGFMNITGETMQGAQSAGFMNIAGEDGGVFQSAGFGNVVGQDFHGAQFGGVLNVVGEDVRGAQFAGLFNVVGGHLRGLQASGLFNVAASSEGVQLGLVNVSGENTGVPIGLVSYVQDVRLRYDVWGDETGFLHTALRSGNRRVANYLGVGARPFGDETYRWALVAGLGVELPMGDRAFWMLEALQHTLVAEDFGETPGHLSRLRLLAGYRLSDTAALFGGPTFNVFVDEDHDGSDLAPWSVYTYEGDDVFVRMWPGFTAGLRIYARR